MSICDPGSRSPTTDFPGATKSGLRTPSPLLDQVGTESSVFDAVPFGSEAPTAITYGSNAGSFSVSEPYPEFPADATMTIPLRHATSAA